MELKARVVNDLLINGQGLFTATDVGLYHGDTLVAPGEVIGLAERSDGKVFYAKRMAAGLYDPLSETTHELPLAAMATRVASVASGTAVVSPSGFHLWMEGETSLDYVPVSGSVLDLMPSASGTLVLTSDRILIHDGSLTDAAFIVGTPDRFTRLEGREGVAFADGTLAFFASGSLAMGSPVSIGGHLNGTLPLSDLQRLLLFGSQGPVDDGIWSYDVDMDMILPVKWDLDSANEVRAASLQDNFLAYADKDYLTIADIDLGVIVNRIEIVPPADLLPLALSGTWQSAPIHLGGVSAWLDAEMTFTGAASGAKLELRSKGYVEDLWQPWQDPEGWASQRPGDEVQLRLLLESPDGTRNVEVQGVTLAYSDREKNRRELHVPLWDHQLFARESDTAERVPLALASEDPYLKPIATNLDVDLRAASRSYPLTLVVDGRALNSHSLPTEIALSRVVLYADDRKLEANYNFFIRQFEATLEQPCAVVGAGLNQFAYAQTTRNMAEGFPSWMRLATDPSSEGQKWLNVMALELEEVREQLRVHEDALFLETSAEEPSRVGVVQVDADGRMVSEPWKIVHELDAFYYNLDTPVAYRDPFSGALYVTLAHQPFLLDGQVLSVENGGIKPLDLYNSLDNFGDLLDLKRLPGESNAKYLERLSDIFVNPANSTLKGLKNGISRELGIPKEWVSVNQLGSWRFMDELFTEDGLPTERMRHYVRLINSQAMVRWGFFRWDESFWLDDNSEAYLPSVSDPRLSTRKLH